MKLKLICITNCTTHKKTWKTSFFSDQFWHARKQLMWRVRLLRTASRRPANGRVHITDAYATIRCEIAIKRYKYLQALSLPEFAKCC